MILQNRSDIEKKNKTLKIALLLLFITFLIFVLISLFSVITQEKKNLKDRLNRHNNIFLNETETFFSTYVSLFNGLAQSDSVRDKQTEVLFSYFQRVNLMYPEIENIAAVDEYGFFFGSGKPFDAENPPNVINLGFFQNSIKSEKGYVIMEPHKGPISGSDVTGLVVRLEDEDFQFKGVLGGSIRLSKLGESWDKLSASNRMKIISLRENGELLYVTDGNCAELIRDYQENTIRESYVVDGKKYYSQQVFVEELNSTVLLLVQDFIPYTQAYFERPINVFAIVIFSILFVIVYYLRFREMEMLRLLYESQDKYQKSHAEFQAIFNAIPDAIIFIDQDNYFLMCNPAFTTMFGYDYSQIIGKSMDILFFDLQDEPIHKIINKANHSSENSSHFKIEYKRKDGSIFPGETIGLPVINSHSEKIGYLYLIRDISSKVRLEELVIQNEKMHSIGGLAAGMAHEVNNPLAGMVQTAGVLAARLGQSGDFKANISAAEESGTTIEAISKYMELREVPRMLSFIHESGKRISEIINNMLSFSRKNIDDMSPVDIKDLIEKTLSLAAADYDLKKNYDFKKIRIDKYSDQHIPLVICSEGKIQQVFMNIFRNGAEAMNESGTADPQFNISLSYDESLKILIINIKDNGPGMSAEIRKRIFEPFYTTKAVGAGTGLGLSVSYFIITENHQGEMFVESEPGRGTKFVIHLPLKPGS